EVEVAPDVTGMRADLTKVRQSLFNLLSNAAKFTQEGHIALSVRREAERGRDWIVLAVSDTGIGIPADKLDHIFDEFSQADESTRRNFGGTGLGLAITRKFCQLMGGDIAVRSVLGEGSTFTIRLPLEEEPAGAVASAARAAQAGARGERRTVLLIDDD